MDAIRKPDLIRKWARCPYCGAKSVIYTNNADCSGVFIKCSRGCKTVFELVIVDGEQRTGDKNNASW